MIVEYTLLLFRKQLIKIETAVYRLISYIFIKVIAGFIMPDNFESAIKKKKRLFQCIQYTRKNISFGGKNIEVAIDVVACYAVSCGSH